MWALSRLPSQHNVTSVRNSSSLLRTLNEFAKCWQWECHFNENCCEAIWKWIWINWRFLKIRPTTLQNSRGVGGEKNFLQAKQTFSFHIFSLGLIFRQKNLYRIVKCNNPLLNCACFYAYKTFVEGRIYFRDIFYNFQSVRLQSFNRLSQKVEGREFHFEITYSTIFFQSGLMSFNYDLLASWRVIYACLSNNAKMELET